MRSGRRGEHGRLRSLPGHRGVGQGAGRVGARRWRLRAVGHGRSRAIPPDRRPGRRRLVGDRCAQVAQRALRLRDCAGQAAGGSTQEFRGGRWLPAARRRVRGHAPHACVLPAGPAGRGVGRAAYARAAGRDRPGRTDLRPRPGDGGVPAAGGPGRAQRCRAQPGAGPGGHRRADAGPRGRRPAGRNVLVRPDHLAAPARDADQRVGLGDIRRRRQEERGCHHRRRGARPVIRSWSRRRPGPAGAR